MVLATAAQIVTKLTEGSDKDGVERNNVIKRTLGLADIGIPIGREGEPAGYLRWDARENDAFHAGATEGGSENGLKWREFLWSGPLDIDECKWGAVRWRFYSNGLVCFDANMSNASEVLDNGDVQGHRIELREKNGMLLGVWIAGFFVRRSLPMRGFAASYQDDHAPLKLHFDEIADTHQGAWICI